MTRDLLAILNTKTCSGCTKCCEGYLSANIKGHEMYPGKPCPFVTPNVGCNDYENRPIDPCVGFQCEWRRNPYFDEWLSPNNSQAVFTRQIAGKLSYLSLIEAGKPLDSKVLTWAIEHAKTNGLNLLWEVNGYHSWLGSIEFDAIMRGMYRNESPL